MNSINGSVTVGVERALLSQAVLPAMIRARRYFATILLAVLVGTALPVYADSVEITTDQWARPRSGERIVEFDALRSVVDYLDRYPKSMVTIRHAGGDEGLLWAEELRGWFVALGVEGNRIVLRTGLQQPDRIVLDTE
jgi:hypothetical protein